MSYHRAEGDVSPEGHVPSPEIRALYERIGDTIDFVMKGYVPQGWESRPYTPGTGELVGATIRCGDSHDDNVTLTAVRGVGGSRSMTVRRGLRDADKELALILGKKIQFTADGTGTVAQFEGKATRSDRYIELHEKPLKPLDTDEAQSLLEHMPRFSDERIPEQRSGVLGWLATHYWGNNSHTA